MIRRIFWNVRKSFFGVGMLTLIPVQTLYFPVLCGLPIYAFSILQSGITYYDEYDGDTVEGSYYNKRQ